MSDSTDYNQLRNQLDLLKDQYVKLLNERDVLVNWAEPELLALYTTNIGKWLIQRLKIQLSIKSLQLKIEKVTSAFNQLQPVNISNIELEVATMLAEAEQQIMAESEKLEWSSHLLKSLMSPAKSNALRKLYCEFAKKLHPDVNENITPEMSNLWLIVKHAYESGDVEKLESLKIVYDKELGEADTNETLQSPELLNKLKKLKQGIKYLIDDITNIKEHFPFTIEKNIRDEEWIQNETISIKKDIDLLNTYEQQLKKEYDKLISKV